MNLYDYMCSVILTVRWHAVALRMVSVRCVRPWRLQGGAVLGLSIRSHDTSPGQLILEKEEITRKPFVTSSPSLYLLRQSTDDSHG